MTITDLQQAELAKYRVTYEHPLYRMSDARRKSAQSALAELPWRGSYLDVSCGRGEMLAVARDLGFRLAKGTETVDGLLGEDVVQALGWSLPFPDDAFEVVTLFDVIEHILPGDDERVCRELARVASKAILLTANNRSSMHKGVELHINRRTFPEWHRLFRAWFPGKVTWLKQRRAKFSEMWRIDLA